MYFLSSLSEIYQNRIKSPPETNIRQYIPQLNELIQRMKQKAKVERHFDGDFALSALIYKQKSCEICTKKHNEASMVLCDRCEDAYHIRCIMLTQIPEGTWICERCMIDINRLKQEQLMIKRPVKKSTIEECAGCKQTMSQYFEFEEGETRFEARFINLVTCTSCKKKFHSLCFSQRPTGINCSWCQQAIRDNIPKGHSQFLKFMKDSRTKIGNLNYLELVTQIHQKNNVDYGSLPCMQLLAPTKPKDWRIITAYEASLCYALMTRGMIYCQNLVVEMRPERLDTVIQGHRNSVEKLYRLHKTDQQVYQTFKAKFQEGYLPPLEIRQDRKKGFYMIATDYIAANTIIAEYAGQLITARESLNMISNQSIFTLIRNPRSSDSLDIAPNKFANIAIFISGINNSQAQTSQLQNVRALKFCYKGIARLILYTLKDIRPRETLYLNYNGDKAMSEYPTNDFVV